MKLKLILPLIFSGILFSLFLLMPVEWFSTFSKKEDIDKNATSLSDSMLKGVHSQSIMLKNGGYYPIMGSSELEKPDIFHPAHILNDKNAKLKPYLIGTAGSTDLMHAIDAGSQSQNLKGKKIAIIISPQWFTNRGITNDNFSARFSPLQANELFMNEHLSPELKNKFAKRLTDFKELKSDSYLKSVIKAKDHQYNEGTFMNNFEYSIHEKHDALKSIFGKESSPLEERHSDKLAKMDWKEMRSYASEYGEEHSTSNKYGMKNEYWKLLKKQQRRFDRSYEFNKDSVEFQDLQLLIDTLKEAKADPLFVVIPANGKWYDHIGVEKNKREAVYRKINDTITSNDMKVYDLTDKEYEPYVITDAVHIGWKGWVYINEQMMNHVNGKYNENVSRKFN